jgi:hypothetical protein
MQLIGVGFILIAGLLLHDVQATMEDMEFVEVIDYSNLVVFDAFNGSYLSDQDYRGLLLPTDQHSGTTDL